MSQAKTNQSWTNKESQDKIWSAVPRQGIPCHSEQYSNKHRHQETHEPGEEKVGSG